MKRKEKREDKRAAILEAASAVFKDRRFDEVKLDEIAARASVGKGTLYLYFKNKEDLFLQLAVEGIGEMAARVAEIAAMPTSYEDRFFLFGGELGSFLHRRHGLIRLMQQSLSDEIEARFDVHRKKIIFAVHNFLQQGVDEDALRSDFRTDELQCLLVGPFFLRSRMEDKTGKKIELASLLRFFWEAAAAGDARRQD